jgi:arylsulfatase A-like enzyme
MDRKEKALEITFPFLGGALSLVVLTLLLEIVLQGSRVSFFSQLNRLQQSSVVINSLFFLSAPILVFGLLLYGFTLVFFRREKILQALRYGYFFLLSLAFLIVVLSHADTFIYTAFRRNIFLFPFFVNIILLLLILEASVLLTARKSQSFSDFFLSHRRAFSIILGLLCVVLMIPFLVILKRIYVSAPALSTEKRLVTDGSLDNRLNIVIITADGLDRRRLGVYGYVRDTTPNLSRFDRTVVYMRAYPNCGNSRGSIMAVLTGKNPISTKLVFPPDILHGKDALQHLPHVLARLGYYNVDINDGFFASPRKSNLRYGFHCENGQETRLAKGFDFWDRIFISTTDETYFLANLFERHLSKIVFMATSSLRSYHSFHDRFSENIFSFQEFMEFGEGTGLTDRKRIDMLKQIIREVDRPIFAHVHLMGTHGPAYEPPYRKFSLNGNQTQLMTPEKIEHENQRLKYLWEHDRDGYLENVQDRYDDAILSADHYFGEIIDSLTETGKLERTLVMFLTDHGQRTGEHGYNSVLYPLPLIVHLPGQEEKIEIKQPVQYLDIAPSILSLIEQPVPKWMEGNIIFGRPMDTVRFSAGPQIAVMTTASKKNFGARHLKTEFGPPTYGIDVFRLVDNEYLYVYIRTSNTRRLYKVGDNPFSLQEIQNGNLVDEYHQMLCKLLEEEDIYIRSEP